MERGRFNRAAGLALTTLLCAGAGAQWTVINLHPAGATTSMLTGVQGNQQVGSAFFSAAGSRHAALWTGSAASCVDLHAGAPGGSEALDLGDGQQVGTVKGHASIWSGSAASWIDIDPGPEVGSLGSEATGVSGGQQGGYLVRLVNGVQRNHACVWSGSRESYTTVHPANAVSSVIQAVRSGRQFGSAIFSVSPPPNVVSHAMLWSGAPGAFIDLHPAGYVASSGFGMDDVQQVGSCYRVAIDHGGKSNACVWSGAPETLVNLHGSGGGASSAWAVFDGRQVGYGEVDGQRHAMMWRGSSESRLDLHVYLGPEFLSSEASGIWSDGETVYVAGSGYNTAHSRDEAILWVKAPTCVWDLNGDGLVNDADFVAFASQYDILSCADPTMARFCPADFNGDSVVDDADFVIFVGAYDRLICP